MYYARLTKEFAKYEPKSPHNGSFASTRENEDRFRRFSEPMTTNRMNNVVERAERLTGMKKYQHSSSGHYKQARAPSRHSGTLKRQPRGLKPLLHKPLQHKPLQHSIKDQLGNKSLRHRHPTRAHVILEEMYSTPPKPLPKYSVPQWTNYTPKLTMNQIKSRKPTPVKDLLHVPASPESQAPRTRSRVTSSSKSQSNKSTLGFNHHHSINNHGHSALSRQLKDSQKKFDNLEGTHRQLKHKYDEAIADTRQVKDKYKETKAKLSEITARLQSERTLLGRMHDEFTRLHTKHVKLHEKHDVQKKDHKQLRKDADERQSEILQHKLATERMTTELDHERAKNVELQQKLKNTARDRENTRAKIDSAMLIIRKMKDELARYRRKHRELKAKYQVIKEKYEVAQMNHKDLAIVKQDVRRELEKEFRREIEALKKSHKEQIEKLEGQLQQDRAFASNLVKSKDSYITRLQEHNRLLQQHLKLIKQALEHRLMGLEEESRAMSRDILRIRKGMNAPGAAAPPPQAKHRADNALKQAEDWVANRFTTQCYQIKRQIDTISTIVESEGPSTIRTDITSLNGTVRSVIQPGEAPKQRHTPTPKPSLSRKITPRRAPTPTATPKRPNLGMRPTGDHASHGPGAGAGITGMSTRPW